MMKVKGAASVGERPQLRKVLGRVEVFALAFGTMIAWGPIALPVQWINTGGLLGTIISIILTMIMCSFVGLIYAQLISAFPLAGGELAFTYRSMGVLGSWITGWMICLAYIGVAAFEGIALSVALRYLVPIPNWGYFGSIGDFDVYFSWVIVGIIGAVVLTILNIIGIRKVAIIQILLILVILFTGIFYCFGALSFGEVNNTSPMIKDMKGIEMVLIMVPSMFIGFDIVAKSAEEMNMPLRNVSKVLIFSICVAGLWYIALILATYFLLPQVGSDVEVNTIADISAIVFESEIIKKMIIIGGICGILTSWNGFIVGASRIIFAMSRAKLLPGIFSKVHPKHNTPVVAIIFVGLFCCVAPFLGPEAFDPFLNIVSFSVVISYLMVSISYLLISRNEPDLRKEYRIKYERTTGFIAIVCILFFLFLYTPLNPIKLDWFFEWIIIAVWVILGAIFFLFIKTSESNSKISAAERETLIYSDEFAREL